MWRKLRGDHCTGRCWDHILFFLATAIHQLGARVLSCFSCVRFFATLWTVAHPAPLSMGFSREEYWSGLPCPPPGDLPDPGIKPASVSCIGRWILYHQHHLGIPFINYFHQRNQLRFSFWLWCSVYRDICFQILGSWHGICVSFYENLPTSMQSYLPTKRIGKLSLMEIHRVKRMSKPVESVCLCYAMLSCSVVPDPLWPHGL